MFSNKIYQVYSLLSVASNKVLSTSNLYFKYDVYYEYSYVYVACNLYENF